ncbi:MAG TPA: glycosyltransferase family 2 protein [bacterium]|nr:glycosyltransferase family 2 protein [bacterium]
MVFLTILLWFSFSGLLYIYLGYPIILFLFSLFRSKHKGISRYGNSPSVTLIIPARNEEKVIEQKIENCLALEYCEEELEIIILSDQSTDRTAEIVRYYQSDRIKLIELKERYGKTAAQNLAVKQARGEIIVFSDANAMYKPDALEMLVRHFQDATVGCVCGELCYSKAGESAVVKEEGLYWSYEKFLKRCESSFFSIVGANGSIYAIRKTDYHPLSPDVISDFIEPLEIVRQGKKAVYESYAISIEDTSASFREELIRKRRIIARSIYSILKHKTLLNPIHCFPLFFELVSHKILRWLSPIFQILLFLSNLILFIQGYYQSIFILQCLFYGLSLIGWMFSHKKYLPSSLFIPFYFNLISYASLLGMIDWVRKKHAIFWEPVR